MSLPSTTSSARPVGEVVAASTGQFTAQCLPNSDGVGVPELPDPPTFGAFVAIGRPDPNDVHTSLPDDFDPFESPALSAAVAYGEPVVALYGVVFHAEIGALEAGRTLTAFGLDEETLRRDQPQIFELLATRFTAALIAYESAVGTIQPQLPPRPPRPHAQVWLADDATVRRLTERLDYLRPLLLGPTASAYPADDLAAAILRNGWRSRGGDDAFLLRAGRQLAALLPTGYDRLRAILSQVAG